MADPLTQFCGAVVACSVAMQTTPSTGPARTPPPKTEIAWPAPPPVQAVAIKPPPRANVIPPPEFDKPYTGEVFIIAARSRDEVRALCKNPNDPIGVACAIRHPDKKSCRIIIAPEADVIASGYTIKLVLRHENGHCNNWSAKHEGSRMATEADR